MIPIPKQKQPDAQIVASLENLKKEILEKYMYNPDMRMVLFKINSCLYREYPHNPKELK